MYNKPYGRESKCTWRATHLVTLHMGSTCNNAYAEINQRDQPASIDSHQTTLWSIQELFLPVAWQKTKPMSWHEPLYMCICVAIHIYI